MTLIGAVTDTQDGELTGDSLVWTSNLVGEPLGTGEGPFSVQLPLGKHMLTLTATDSDGNTNSRTVKVWVKDEL